MPRKATAQRAARRADAAPPDCAYQFKVTLKGIRPPVWRRVLVDPRRTLADLHETIQALFGWYDSHLHCFEVGCDVYEPAGQEVDAYSGDEARVPLNRLGLEPGDKFKYTYDFGDDWVHEVLLEKVLDSELPPKLPWCIKGARATPPEDCGGPYGYAGLLEALADPSHEAHAEAMEWAGGRIDPAAFHLDTVNSRLGPLAEAPLRSARTMLSPPPTVLGTRQMLLDRVLVMMQANPEVERPTIRSVDAPPRVLQLKITLAGMDPPVWRRVLVESHASLAELHWVIQRLFEWYGDHLHVFARASNRCRPDWQELHPDSIDEDQVRLCDLGLRTRMKLQYVYDWGDYWLHEILVERTLDPDPAVAYPVCIDGERAAPMEDMGGRWGWEARLAAYRDPDDPDHAEMVAILGESFDPDQFDVAAANEALQWLRGPRAT